MGQFGSRDQSLGESVLEEVIESIKNETIQNVIIMCGAGISTSAGIPDFRSPSTGLYFKLRKYNLPFPEAIFEASYFKQNPAPFYHLVRELFPEELTPTDTHRFFTLLHEKRILKRIYTQNIDALEHIAGVPEEKIIEAHGTFHRNHCVKCRKDYSLDWLKNQLFGDRETGQKFDGGDPDYVPKCESCGGVVRPDIVFFGEALPDKLWRNIKNDFSACDLLIVLGTSLTVQPFANLVGEVAKGVPRLFINRTKPGKAGLLGSLMGLGADIDFKRSKDQLLLQDCDETVHQIVEKLSWESDFAAIPKNSMKL
ncbi:Oidioi.mRNA.OKI2018_I69.chr2.g5533.t1.cds [Oikopleura dioica]|uniref:NAD-dependent protein deacetylase n=1 Tax=Oikopleura dioica TaxID=34765 RepID=A0ABN7T4Z8_OIKDI|nr:Oidioi.mRNA.OKI2018_I69.chr2.g5533.t1.cds [Oikopleura dioica]